MSEDLEPRFSRRRILIAIGVAALLHVLLFVGARNRHGEKEPAKTEAAAAAAVDKGTGKPLAVDLRATGPAKPVNLSLSSGLNAVPATRSGTPALPQAAPISRQRLAFSAALGDGDAGRRGFSLDRLLAPFRRAAAKRDVAAVPLRSAAPDTGPAIDVLPAQTLGGESLARLQAQALRAAAQQRIEAPRLEPRAVIPEAPQKVNDAAAPPNPGPVPAPGAEAEIGNFFNALTARLVAVNQAALASAVKAGEREPIEVRFVVERDGRISIAAPQTPSDSPALDAAAVRIITAASPLPALPAALPQQRLELTFPVQVYR